MYVINDDHSIACTRGDAMDFPLPNDIEFFEGDVIRFQVFKKKNCTELVLRKDFVIEEVSADMMIHISGDETKFGGIINKPTDFWYEVEINPGKASNTIIGYDGEGAKVFTLYPEGFDGIYTQEEFTESAYTIAQEQGFKGTKEEWLASLNGEKGDKGDAYVLTDADKQEIAEMVIDMMTNGDEVAY